METKPSPKLLDQLMQKKYSTIPHGIPPSISGGSGSSPGQRVRSAAVNGQEQYANKLKKIRRAIKDTIFVNGAVCDEVLRTEEKLAKAKEERRFLLRKLLQYQSVTDTPTATVKTESQATPARQPKTPAGSLDPMASETSGKPSKGVKRKAAGASPVGAGISPSASLASLSRPGDAKKKAPQSAKEILDSLQVRPKKSKGVNRKVIPPLMLDSLGRPVFPMALGDVTLHSIGEIVPDRLSFHCPDSIYPVGYCITRVYASLHKLDTKCLYTCKISDNNDGPLFEIAAEDSSDIVFKATTPTECHSLLLRAVNKSRGEILPTEGRGLDFFGLSHPVIQNLVQSCPGARKCSRYKWVKFEINKAETNDNVAVGVTDPCVSYDALKMHMIAIGQSRPGQNLAAHVEQSTNLRSLLTKGSGQGSSS
ncbi:transforming growth factor beta regulator 1 isoform X2 [Aplysia californica]|nr:transforming growth factor beta regulator 1 isoform X2 [Aplysia californica]